MGWPKGKKRPPRTKEWSINISEAKKGKKNPWMVGAPPAKGRKRTVEFKLKQRESHLGKKNPKHSKWMEENNPMKRVELRNNQSKRITENNPMKLPEVAKRSGATNKGKKKSWVSDRMKNGQAAYMCSCNKNPSKEQVQLFSKVKLLYPSALLNYPYNNYCIDIVIPELMIAIEFDGYYFHKGREETDRKRQREIEKGGWRFLRYNKLPNDNELNKTLLDMERKHGESNYREGR